MVFVTVWPTESVTTTDTEPAACDVVVQVSDVDVGVPDTVHADPPNDAVDPASKFDPVIVTTVPPFREPLVGFRDDKVGAALYVNAFANDPV